MKKVLVISIILLSIFNMFLFAVMIYNKTNKFEKYNNNPVLGNKTIGTLFDPNVIEADNKLYMYVSNRKNSSIEVYSSDDGINWNSQQTALTNNLQSGWENSVNRCSVIYKDNKYKMWYTGQEGENSYIGYAESDDLYNFKRIQSNTVIIPEKSFEKKSVMNPYVMYDEEKQIYRMWYSAGEQYEPDVIGYAESDDGIIWNKYDNPIFGPSNIKGTYDEYKIGGCEVKKFDNKYYMFYIGYTDVNTAYIMCAESKDGISNWKRISKQPLVAPSNGKFDEKACYKPTVYYNKNTKTLMLWYNGRKGADEYIGLATYKKNIFSKFYIDI